MSSEERAIAHFRAFLDSYGLSHQVGDDNTLWGLIAGENVRWHWLAYTSADDGFLSFIAYSPISVPKHRVAAVCEYLHRLNWGLVFGNFDMRWDTREITFRTSVPLHCGRASRSALNKLYFASKCQMEFYLPGILSVAISNVDPDTAIHETECGLAGAASPATDASVDEEAADRPANGARARRFFSEN